MTRANLANLMNYRLRTRTHEHFLFFVTTRDGYNLYLELQVIPLSHVIFAQVIPTVIPTVGHTW